MKFYPENLRVFTRILDSLFEHNENGNGTVKATAHPVVFRKDGREVSFCGVTQYIDWVISRNSKVTRTRNDDDGWVYRHDDGTRRGIIETFGTYYEDCESQSMSQALGHSMGCFKRIDTDLQPSFVLFDEGFEIIDDDRDLTEIVVELLETA